MKRFWAIGDLFPCKEAYAFADMIKADMIKADTTKHRLLYLGDVYHNGTVDDFATNYDPVLGQFKSITHPIPGNHEWHSKLSGYRSYWTGVEPYYSRDYEGWKILFIDSNYGVHPGNPQYEWAANHSKNWKGPVIVCHHHPRFANSQFENLWMGPILDLFRDRICVGLSGHSHNLQLFRPFFGFTQVIAGNAGHPDHHSLPSDPRLAWGSESLGVLRFDLSPCKMDAAFLEPGGQVLHEFSIC
jgi:hypothetical protein